MVNAQGKRRASKALMIANSHHTYSFPGAPALSPELEKKSLLAFWVLVKAGSSSIVTIMRGRYPCQLAFIAHGNQIFDVTVINNEQDARLAQKIRNEYIAKNEVDITTHIGIVHRESDLKFLENYGFDFGARVNQNTHDIVYTRFDI